MPLHGENLSGPLSTVAIFGPGLIGGSLALALQLRKPDLTLHIWARSESSAKAAAKFFPNVSTDARAAASRADLCVLCTPLGAMPGLAREIVDCLAPDTIVTDAGSAKAPVVAELEGILGGRFVGSHPMAGSERSGLEAARATLFDGATAIVTPTPQSLPGAISAVRALWAHVGCRLVELSPAQHDDAVARISHLPHAVAAALVNAISVEAPEAASLAGGGYRDTTRIAASPPALWTEIMLENKTPLLAALDDFTRSLEELKKMLLTGDASALAAFLARAQEARDSLP